jgi:hypothetical protein
MISQCPACGKRLTIADEVVDKQVRCPECGHLFCAPPCEFTAAPAGVTVNEAASQAGAAAGAYSASIAERREYRLLILGAIFAAVISGGIGLAIGLNIHPPDQHELEKGYEAGLAAGYQTGAKDGYDQAFSLATTEIQRMKAKVAQMEAGIEQSVQAELVRLRRADQTELEQQIHDRNIVCDRRIRDAKARAYTQGQNDLRREVENARDAAIAAARLEFRVRYENEKAQLEKQAYDKGLLAGGYQQGYDKGLILGKTQGKRACLHDCAADIQAAKDGARRVGYDEGLKAGDPAGFRRGRAEGERIGYQLGIEKGNRSGYQRGYNDGWRAAGGK